MLNWWFRNRNPQVTAFASLPQREHHRDVISSGLPWNHLASLRCYTRVSSPCTRAQLISRCIKVIVSHIIHISTISSSAAGYSRIYWRWECLVVSLAYPCGRRGCSNILRVFWIYARRFPFLLSPPNSTHSVNKAPRKISLNGPLTPFPLLALSHVHKQARRNTSPVSFPFLPVLFSNALSRESLLIWHG